VPTLALLTFNKRVEIGQMLFIGCLLGVLAAAARINLPPLVVRHAPAVVRLRSGSSSDWQDL
jgi:hypothetical protein